MPVRVTVRLPMNPSPMSSSPGTSISCQSPVAVKAGAVDWVDALANVRAFGSKWRRRRAGQRGGQGIDESDAEDWQCNRVDQDECQVKGARSSLWGGQAAEDDAKGNAGELHQQDGQDEFGQSESQFGAIDCGHCNDRADGIVVD